MHVKAANQRYNIQMLYSKTLFSYFHMDLLPRRGVDPDGGVLIWLTGVSEDGLVSSHSCCVYLLPHTSEPPQAVCVFEDSRRWSMQVNQSQESGMILTNQSSVWFNVSLRLKQEAFYDCLQKITLSFKVLHWCFLINSYADELLRNFPAVSLWGAVVSQVCRPQTISCADRKSSSNLRKGVELFKACDFSEVAVLCVTQ